MTNMEISKTQYYFPIKYIIQGYDFKLQKVDTHWVTKSWSSTWQVLDSQQANMPSILILQCTASKPLTLRNINHHDDIDTNATIKKTRNTELTKTRCKYTVKTDNQQKTQHVQS